MAELRRVGGIVLVLVALWLLMWAVGPENPFGCDILDGPEWREP